jgi:leucyl/phenylalanyl-tRNA--protein transferase
MRQLIRSSRYEVRWNTAFEEVIKACAMVPRKQQQGTWINDEMIAAYVSLHQQGLAHSVEVWESENLVGGLYGVVVGKVFCGESMFSKQANTSKLALIALCRSGYFDLVDCQLYTEHLERMGAQYMGRDDFMEIIDSSLPQ